MGEVVTILTSVSGHSLVKSFSGTVSNPALPTDVVDVDCVALSEKYLLGFLWGLFGLGYIPYTPYIVFFFCEKEEY